MFFRFSKTSKKTTFSVFLSFFLVNSPKFQSLKLNISRTAWPILMILVSFCRILNGLSDEINLFWRCSSPLKNGDVKALSHDPFSRIRFLVPKTGSRRSDSPISRFRFCGENVGRSFVVCSHDPFFKTNKESSIWRQNDHAKFVGTCHLSRRVSDENRTCSFPSVFSKLRIRLMEGHF